MLRITMTMEQRKNIVYLDVLRSCSVYFVIALHTVAPILRSSAAHGSKTWWLCNAIDLFARMGVPLFFMISGYLILSDPRTAEALTFYRRRVKRLMLPLFFWNCFYYLWNCILAQKKLVFTDFL